MCNLSKARTCGRGARLAALMFPGALFVAVTSSHASAYFPQRLETPAPAAQRGWTMADIVEVTRITDTAIDSAGERVAFVLKQPSIGRGKNLYALYLAGVRSSEAARKLLEAAYIGELEQRPGTKRWTVRADFGEGVQLYEIGEDGKRGALLINPQLAPVGGPDGLVLSAVEAQRPTGILDYSWAPDGSTLWYTKLNLATPGEREAFFDHGIVYDATTAPFNLYGEPAAKAIELRAFEPTSNTDRLITSMPGDARNGVFAYSSASVRWVSAKELVIRTRLYDASGRPSTKVYRYDLSTGRSRLLSERVAERAFTGAALADGYLVLKPIDGSRNRLVRVADEDAAEVDLGEVPYSGIGGAQGAWHGVTGHSILGVRSADRIGLMIFPRPSGGAPVERIEESLTNCSFDETLTVGACSRESLTRAPELVAVSPLSGGVTVLARPNARYDAIVPLRSESASWTNKFGATRNGYITYPRDHRPGQRHATVVITHASDARNLFAYDGFQWAFPLQVLAERGYLVLSVNERPADPQVSEAYASHRAKTSVERMQRGQGLEAVATMEAAVQSVVDRGVADPRRVGIAGYSRGGIVTTLTLSQSRMFKAGINADTGFFSAGGFWRSASVRELYRTLFGGPPLDPRFSDHYRAFSPSARADKFAGPLLQFFTGTNGQAGVELDQALKEAGVPTQLIVYPGETHVLHRPRTIESAMQCSLDWFDFWLNDREDPAASRIVQYERWRRLRQSQPRR